MQAIYDYTSFRQFLKDEYFREKNSSRRTTLALYAKQFGMSAASFNMILSGSRNLTVEGLHQIARALRLSPQEHEYFEALVLREQSLGQVSVQRYYTRKLKKLSGQTSVKNVRISDKNIVSDWLIPALLIYLVDFDAKEKSGQTLNFVEIAKKFKVPAEHLFRLVEKLKKSGLLKIDSKDGVHIVLEKLMASGPQKNYVKTVLSELLNRIDQDFERRDTLYRSFVFTVEKTAIPELRSEIMSVFEKFMAQTSEKPDENALIQSLVAFFPVLE